MNAKRKGTRNEHRSAQLLEGAGYAVTRATASLGVWDLTGIGHRGLVLCQVMTLDSPSTVEALRSFPAPPNAPKPAHRWRDRRWVSDVRGL